MVQLYQSFQGRPLIKKIFLQSLQKIQWSWPSCRLNLNTHKFFNTSIDISSWEIVLEINPEILNNLHKSTLENLICNRLNHERGHWQICPYDIEYHVDILEGISKVFKEQSRLKLKEDEKKLVIFELINAFEDIIVDTTLSRNCPGYSQGLAIFYREIFSKRKILPFHRLFVAVEKKLCGFESPIDKKNKNLINKLLKIFNQKIENKNNWKKLARQWAETLLPHLDGLFKGQVLNQIFLSDNFFTLSMKRKGASKEEILIEVKKRHFAPQWMSEREWLDFQYKKQADEIVIKEDKKNEKTEGIPYLYLQKRKVDPFSKLSLSRISWTSTRVYYFGEDEEWWFYQKELPLKSDFYSESQGKELLDLAFIVDSSDSMDWDKKKMKGKYHILLVSFYSILAWLEKTGKGFHLNYSLITFSDKTYFSNWKSYYEIEEIKDLLLEKKGNVQHNYTLLDPEVIENMINSTRSRFFAILITDSEIKNLKKIIPALKCLCDKGNPFCLFQIGRENKFCRIVKELGGEVYVIRDKTSIPRIILSKARNIW